MGLELTKVFPLRKVVNDAGAEVLACAGNLPKTGSDIVVETDIGKVFGQASIEPQLEEDFKDVVKHEDILPVMDDGREDLSEIALKSATGPTVRNALANPDRAYMKTVIHLSLLGWSQQKSRLVTMISEALDKRFNRKTPDARPSPGFHGILNTFEKHQFSDIFLLVARVY